MSGEELGPLLQIYLAEYSLFYREIHGAGLSIIRTCVGILILT